MVLNENPYKSPNASSSAPCAHQNRIARIGFVLSVTGVLGVLVVGSFGSLMNTVGMYVAFLSLPGTAISAMGLWRQPKRLAALGVVLGIFGTLYLPTFYLSMFVSPYR